MSKKAIKTDQAPLPVAPYSQAIRVQDLLFVSGQIAINLVTGEMNGETTTEQARIALGHLRAILKAAGLDLHDVVKSEIFLTNMEDAKAFNEVYGEFFSKDPPPARHLVEVSRLPLNAKVEISCIAAFSVESEE